MNATIYIGDALNRLREIPDESVNCVCTSPPYWGLRDYGVEGQIGVEKTPSEYLDRMVSLFGEIRRILRSDGTCWVNMGDGYNNAGTGGNGATGGLDKSTLASPSGPVGMTPTKKSVDRNLKPKDLIGMPWRLAFALQDSGWWLRSDIIWAKLNGMPGSQTDRPTSSHEYVFLLTKSAHYWSDFDAIKTTPRESSMARLAQDVQAQAGSHRANGGAEPNGPMKAVAERKELPENQAKIGAYRDKQRGHSRTHAGFNERWKALEKSERQSQPVMMRDVWFVSPASFDEAHFAVMPEEIARRCILAGCPEGGTVLDPFSGSGTTGLVSLRYHRDFIGVELNPEYALMSERRIGNEIPLFAGVEVVGMRPILVKGVA